MQPQTALEFVLAAPRTRDDAHLFACEADAERAAWDRRTSVPIVTLGAALGIPTVPGPFPQSPFGAMRAEPGDALADLPEVGTLPTLTDSERDALASDPVALIFALTGKRDRGTHSLRPRR